jgi:hypothetical protein
VLSSRGGRAEVFDVEERRRFRCCRRRFHMSVPCVFPRCRTLLELAAHPALPTRLGIMCAAGLDHCAGRDWSEETRKEVCFACERRSSCGLLTASFPGSPSTIVILRKVRFIVCFVWGWRYDMTTDYAEAF